ncbi:MAG: hypothetical protein ACI9ZT_001760 [Gammaproteobacteria bacterium]|jgi:hypothetical protein
MIEFFVHGKNFLPEQKAIWRVGLACVVAQLIGGIIGILLGLYGSLFFNFWFGGAIATLPGMILGVAWQWNKDVTNFHLHKRMITFNLVLGILIFFGAVAFLKLMNQ